MIELTRVIKSFGGVVALSDVSVTIGSGVTALLGPNGAGKSTLFRVLAGLTPPSSGSARVMGKDLRSDLAARGLVGLVPQQDRLFEHLTPRRFVALAASLNGVTKSDKAADDALRRVQLDDAADRKIAGFSKGMRQRVKIAAAIVHQPPVLLLDEPLNGLDPVQRGRMIDLFIRYSEAGATVVVSSHVLDEVAEIGSDVVVLVQGRLAATGDYRQLRRMMNDRPQNIEIVTDRAQEFAAELVRQGLANGVSIGATVEGGVIIVQTGDLPRFQQFVARVAHEGGFALDRMDLLDDSLEAVFTYLTTPSGASR